MLSVDVELGDAGSGVWHWSVALADKNVASMQELFRELLVSRRRRKKEDEPDFNLKHEMYMKMELWTQDVPVLRVTVALLCVISELILVQGHAPAMLGTH